MKAAICIMIVPAVAMEFMEPERQELFTILIA